MTETLKPKDSTEAIAVFRSQVIGPLLCRDYGNHGELADAIRELAAHAVTPPGYEVSRYFSIPTLERWYYGFQEARISWSEAQESCSGICSKGGRVHTGATLADSPRSSTGEQRPDLENVGG
jgi:hypothetical protein